MHSLGIILFISLCNFLIRLIPLPICDEKYTTYCKPCPPHASCKFSQITCDPDYDLIRGECQYSYKLQMKVSSMSYQIQYLLQVAKGAYECGSDTIGVLSSEQIISHLKETATEPMSNEQFNKIFDMAVTSPSIAARNMPSMHGKIGFTTTLKAIKPLKCRITESVHKYSQKIILLFTVICVVLLALLSVIKYKRDKEELCEMYLEVINKLVEAHLLGKNEVPVADLQKWICSSGENPKRAMQLWPKFESSMRNDTRIRVKYAGSVDVPIEYWKVVGSDLSISPCTRRPYLKQTESPQAAQTKVQFIVRRQ